MDGTNLASRMSSADRLIHQCTEELNMLESQLTLANRMLSADVLIYQCTEELNMLESQLNPTVLSAEIPFTDDENYHSDESTDI